MYCTYPLEQLLFGFFSGGVIAWAASMLYNSRTSSSPNTGKDEPRTFEVPVPPPGKNVFIFHISDEHVDILRKSLAQTSGEMDDLFEDAVAERDKDSATTKRDVPVSNTQTDGKYRTIEQMTDRNDANIPGRLTRVEEIDIIHEFRFIVGQGYYDALAQVRDRGYMLHPLYVSMGKKMPSSAYSPKILGVRIKDPNFDEATSQPSLTAVISEIVDVGGVDISDRGVIRI